MTISIHALRGEGDLASLRPRSQAMRFLSTPSVGRATPTVEEVRAYCQISIHALRGEGDEFPIFLYGMESISIHALRGEGDISRTP